MAFSSNRRKADDAYLSRASRQVAVTTPSSCPGPSHNLSGQCHARIGFT